MNTHTRTSLGHLLHKLCIPLGCNFVCNMFNYKISILLQTKKRHKKRQKNKVVKDYFFSNDLMRYGFTCTFKTCIN